MRTEQFDPFCSEHSVFTVYELIELYGREGYAIFRGPSLVKTTFPDDVDVKGIINGTWGDKGRWDIRYMNIEGIDPDAILKRIQMAMESGQFLPWKR